MLGSVYTLGTGHIIPVTACREPDVQYVSLNVGKILSFLPTKDLALFFLYISHKKPSFKPTKLMINLIELIVDGIC